MHFKLLPITIKIVQNNAERESCFWNFNSNFELIEFLPFKFWETFRDVYEGNKSGID